MKNKYTCNLLKIKYAFIGAFLLFFLTELKAQTYCVPVFTTACTTYNMYINNFQTSGGVVNINNPNSPCDNLNSNSYSYYTGKKVSTYAGNMITFSATTGPTYATNWRIWVDWNRDGQFNATDEMVWWSASNTSWPTTTGIPANTTVSNSMTNFMVPQNISPGMCRMRIISVYYGSGGIPLATDACNGALPYGDAEDYDFEILSTGPAVPPISNFSWSTVSDTAWLGGQTILVNTSNNAGKSYWDITGFSSTGPTGPFTPVAATRQCNLEGCYIDTVGNAYNFKWIFNTRGWYKIKIKTTNLYGKDSIEKIVYADNPTRKPVANFFTDRRVLGFFDPGNFYDLSLYGPTQWEWYLNPGYIGNSGFGQNVFTNQNGNPIMNYSVQNPVLNPLDGGVFDVCLRVTNIRGSDTLCKPGYVKVTNGYSMCTGGADSVSFIQEGYLYDQGGATQPYQPLLTGNCAAGFRIAPCADTVTLYIQQFKLRAGDSVTIRNGSPTGPILRRLGGSNLHDSLRTWVGTSGQLFIQMSVNPASGAGDSGFTFFWTSKPASYAKPKSAFTSLDTIYSGYKVYYTNQSTGSKVAYMWDSNGDGVYTFDSTQMNTSAVFTTTTPTTKNVCLVAYNCVGYDTTCKTIVILPVSQKPTADFTANRFSGFTTDTFIFIDKSINGPNKWKWTFTPSNVGYINSSDTSQNPVVFLNSATNYTVRLVAINQNGSDTITKTSFATAIAYNSPYTQNAVPSGLDIGIGRVVLNTIDTTTALVNPVYHPLYNNKQTTLYRGVDYTLNVSRFSNNDPMSMKAWIDYNRNTLFGDASNEVLINEVSQNKITSSVTFRIPNNSPLGNSRMRIGISYDNTTLNQDYAGIGVFEDYGIMIGNDMIKPVISLNGPAILKTEVNKTFTDPGVTATDNLEGNISSTVTVTGTVDMTHVGYYTLTYTATDLYGNVSEPVTRLVQVEVNQTGPSITLNGVDPMVVAVYQPFVDQMATAKDNLGRDITASIQVSGSVNSNVLGNYILTYKVVDAFGFMSQKTRTVMVKDTTKPVFSGGTIYKHQIGTTFLDPLTVTDNYWTSDNITVTHSGTINPNVPGSYVLTYYATDGSGNVATPFTITVQVGDLIPPVVFLNGSSIVDIEVYSSFNDPGVTASDNYYSNVVVNKVSNLNTNVLGSYTITYTAADGAANKTTVTRTVNVVDRTAPVISLLGSDPFNMMRYKPYIDPGFQVTDNYYNPSSITVNVDASKVVTHTPGLYYVYYSAMDPSGNKTNVSRKISISEFGEVGIQEHAAGASFTAYPNPTKGKLNVEWGTKSVQTIKVYSIIGTLVAQVNVHDKNATEMQIDLSHLKEGVYIVRLEGTGDMLMRKVNLVK